MTDVLVVGAGLAGLVAARNLDRAGCDVLVLEARDRPGGRVEQTEIPDGRVVQLGGELVGDFHTAYLELVAELGLTLRPSYVVDPGEITLDLVDGTWCGDEIPWMSDADRADGQRVSELFAELSRSVDSEDPWSHPDAERLDRLSVNGWLREVGAAPAVLRAREVAALSLSGGRASAPRCSRHCGWTRWPEGWASTTSRCGRARPSPRARPASRCAWRPSWATAAAGGARAPDRGRRPRRGRPRRRLPHHGRCGGVRGAGGAAARHRARGALAAAARVAPAPAHACAGKVAVAYETPRTPPERPLRERELEFTLGYVTQWAPGDVMAVGPLHGTHEPPFYVAGSDHWVAGYMEGAVRTGRAAAQAILNR